MPYEPFLEAAQAVRYDIDLLGRRFGASFEQVCHRLVSLRRPEAAGIPFALGGSFDEATAYDSDPSEAVRYV